MTIRHIYIIAIIALFAACGSAETDVPKQYIQFDTMVQIMADMQVVEAKGNLARSGSMIEDNKQALKTDYEQMFFNHNTTQARFDTSYSYYARNPKLLDKLLEKTIEELNRRQTEELKKK